MRLTAGRFALTLIVLFLSLSCLCLISSASASPLVKVEVTNTTSGAYESLTVLNPGNGNWIETVGVEEVSLPIINLVYNIKSTNYTKGDKKINIIHYVEESEDYSVHYPFSSHSVYYNDTVTVKVLGEDTLADKPAHIYLIKTDPRELNSMWNSAFDGDMNPLRDLLGNSTHKNITLDGVEDCTFYNLTPGDYVVVAALNESTELNITFISTTAFEVLEHKSTLEAPDVITRTSASDCVFASGDFTIIDADINATYTYIVALIRKDEEFDLRWDCDETKSELNLKLSGDDPLTKSINIFGGVGLGNLDATSIYDWIQSFQTASVEKGVKSGNTYYFSMPVMGMPDGDYYLYAMAYNPAWQKTFVFAVSQKSVKIFTKTAEAKTNETIENANIIIEGTDISIPNATVTLKEGVITLDTSIENATIIAGNITAGAVISIPIEGGALEITLEENATVVNGTVIVNIKKIKLNTPPEEFTTPRPGVGIAKTDLDVEFKSDFTPANLTFSMTMLDDVGDVADLISANASTVENNLLAEFGLAPTDENRLNLVNNTPVLIHAELSATNLNATDVTGVPINITVNKDWFYTVAGGDPSNVMMFKINGTTGEVESKITMTKASIIVNGTVTFSATFDHFCVFALVARPPAAVVAPPTVIRHGVRPTPTPAPALISPVPRDTTAPIISNITVTIERYVIISWDTNEISDSLVKCGMKSGQYTIEEHLPKYVLFHVIPLKQIQLKSIYENTTYYFVVNSTDPNGNSAQTEEYRFVLTPPEKRAIMPFILQIPITLYTHLWWILPATIIVLIFTIIVMPRYKSKRNFDSLTGKPTGTEILMYLYTTFPNVSRPADISKNTNVNLNGVLEALHSISNRNKLESLLGIGLVDKVEYDDEVCYYISKRGKTLIDGLKESFIDSD